MRSVEMNSAIAGRVSTRKDDTSAERSRRARVSRSTLRRIQRNHFKRVMPPIAKVSNRTIGYDFLYLRDWGT